MGAAVKYFQAPKFKETFIPGIAELWECVLQVSNAKPLSSQAELGSGAPQQHSS